MSNLLHPGKAVSVEAESLPKDDSLWCKDESNVESLIKKSMQITEGLKLLQQENSHLKFKLQELQQKYDDLQLRLKDKEQTSHGSHRENDSDIARLKELLSEKQKEVDKFRERLAVMSERKVLQDQRATENTLSANRQSELERSYTVSFRDGVRADATERIVTRLKRSHTGPQRTDRLTVEHLKASRLGCLVFEVSYESAMTVRENFVGISSTILDNLVTKTTSFAFLNLKKPVPSELFQSKSPLNKTSRAVHNHALNEVMVVVKETAVDHNLDKLVQTATKHLETKWKQQWQQCQRSNKKNATDYILPAFDNGLKDSLKKYIEYCCQFSWRMVTQVPPLKIKYDSSTYDPSFHTESPSFVKQNTTSSQIKCYLWPTLLDSDNRVIEKGEVVM